MKTRRILATAVGMLFILLVAVVSMTVKAEALHCNNKICLESSGLCEDQINGPATHCIAIAKPAACGWDFCNPH